MHLKTVSIFLLTLASCGFLHAQHDDPNPFIRQHEVFQEPLVWLGSDPSKPDTDALEKALARSIPITAPLNPTPLEAFLETHPTSPWAPSLHLNLGLTAAFMGRPGAAMAHFEKAWIASRTSQTHEGRILSDRAITEWMWLCMKAGDANSLEHLLQETQNRPMMGGAAQRRADAERALFAMQKEPKFYLCGPTSLATVKRHMKKDHPIDPRDVKDTIPGPQGTSLFQLAMMASNWNIPLQMVKRSPGSPILLPCVMHWKVGHWAAVLEEQNGHFLVQEDVMEEATWVTREALDEETSGYCLAPQFPLPQGWERISPREGSTIWGRGRVGIGPWYGPYPDSVIRPPIPPESTTARAGVRMGNLSLEVALVPLSIPRSAAPAWSFNVRYLQRVTWQPDHPTHSHMGYHWTFTGVSFLQENTLVPQQDVHLFTESGGWLRFTDFDPMKESYAPNPHTGDVLRRISKGHFELHHPDGSLEVFSHTAPDGYGKQRVFRVEKNLPSGSQYRYIFDAEHRLQKVVDRNGEGFTFHHEATCDPWRVSSVEDSHGRQVQFRYDPQGRMTRIIDAGGKETRFLYGNSDLQADVPCRVTTPAGTWVVTHGQEGLSRWVELVDPARMHHHAEFRHNAPGVPQADATAPPGPLNQYMQDRGTYYWISERSQNNPRDYKQAESIRYLFNPSQLALSWTLESTKEPRSPRVWFLYPDQLNTQVEGSRSTPRWVGQNTSKGYCAWDLTWDPSGRLTQLRSLEDPLLSWDYPQGPGRIPSMERKGQSPPSRRWEFSSTGRPLRCWSGDHVIWEISLDPQDRIREVMDMKGVRWTLGYDAYGRWSRMDGPKSYEWRFDALHRVTSLRLGKAPWIPLALDDMDPFGVPQSPRQRHRSRPGQKSAEARQPKNAPIAAYLPTFQGIRLPIPSTALSLIRSGIHIHQKQKKEIQLWLKTLKELDGRFSQDEGHPPEYTDWNLQ